MSVPSAPVAIFVFNRPDLTAQMFQAVRSARPAMLFISADGPRADRPGEEELCAQTRKIVQAVDWDCDVRLNFADHNLGCGPAMSRGINWVFDIVDRAIILEDDCIPDPSFFPFCEQMLEEYQNDSRIMQIAGSNLQMPADVFGGASYSFASFPVVWGWATWRRAWKHYDIAMAGWPAFRDSGGLNGLHASRSRRIHLRREWNHIHAGNGTWDHQWQYTVSSQHGLSVYPATNLITNLGFRADATQTTLAGAMAEVPIEPLPFPLTHPPHVAENARLERGIECEMLRAAGTTVTILRRALPSHRLRRALRKVFLRNARHGPG